MSAPWHTLSPDEALERLEVASEAGLSEDEAARRLAEHGPNELAEEEGPGPLAILWRQLAEPLVLVLVVAAAVSAALWWLGAAGEREPLPYDALVILAIVVLNAVLGFVQEYRAERAVESLKERRTGSTTRPSGACSASRPSTTTPGRARPRRSPVKAATQATRATPPRWASSGPPWRRASTPGRSAASTPVEARCRSPRSGSA